MATYEYDLYYYQTNFRIVLDDYETLFNAGELSGEFAPLIRIRGTYNANQLNSTVFNSGFLTADGVDPVILVSSTSSGAVYIINTGEMESATVAAIVGSSAATVTIENSGTLTGFDFSDNSGALSVLIKNGSNVTLAAEASTGVDVLDYSAWTGTGVTATLGGAATGFSVNNAAFENLIGSNQDDTLTGNSRNNVIIGNGGNDYIDGGTGFDTISYATAGAGVTVNLFIGVVTGGAGIDNLQGIEAVIGSAHGDSITGNFLFNTLDGGPGNDTMNGGDSLDTASFASASAGVIYGLLAQGSAFNTQGAGIDTLSNFENLQGSAFDDTLGGDTGANMVSGDAGNDLLYGWLGNDSLNGGSGNDTLDGGAGNDAMAGGAGDDTYVVDALADLVTESAGQGTDTVFITVGGWTAALNLEAVYLTGSAASITGSAGDDVLVAHATLSSTLSGGDGQDTLWGQAGADSLLGGLGRDVLRAGEGQDLLDGGAGNDQLVGGGGDDVFRYRTADWGYDQIFDFAVNADRIDMAGVATGFEQLTLSVTDAGTVVMLGAARIDVYGAVLSSSDFVFA